MNQKKTPQKKKKIEWRRVLVTVLAAVMLLSLILPLLASTVLNAGAVTQADLKTQISSLKGDAAAAAAKKKEYQEQISALADDKSKALERQQLLAQQLSAIDEQISNTQSQISTYNDLISAQEDALAEAQEKEDAAYERFCQRARSMEESGSISYWSVLFSADSYSDLLDRLALVDEIMEYDNSVVDALAAARQEVSDTLDDLNASKSELDEQKAQLDLQRVDQAAKVAEAEKALDEIKQQESAAQALHEQAEADAKKIEQEIAAKEKELKALVAASTFTTGSGYYYPLPSSNTTVTSTFGPRTCPYHGYEQHTGIDISASLNTEIYAVQGGVVTVSAYAPSSYGNYVMIDHGNGYTTLYAHMNSRAVKVGDVVTQGQVIGYVGHTGSATGNHLHLELKINGTRQNPLTLFPGVKFNITD